MAADVAKGTAFYKGKTINYIIATGAGGGHDFYGRLITSYMKKYLSGATFAVRNMPGAGHIIGANAIYNAKPNGLTFGNFSQGLVYGQLIGRKGVRFDLAKFSWIGKASTDPRVIVVSTKTPYKTFADLKNATGTVKFGSSGVGGGNFNEAYMVRNTFGLPLQIIAGYSGADANLAMLRGEIAGRIGSVSSNDQLVKTGRARYIMQFGGVVPGVPDGAKLAKTADAKAVAAFITSQGQLGRVMAGPPAMQPDRLAAVRAAYRKALADPGLRRDAKKMSRPLDPAFGDDVRKIFVAILDQPDSIKKLIRDITQIKVAMLKHTGKVVSTKRGGRKITIDHNGKQVSAKISGSRTKVTIGGKNDKRKNVKVGMTCTFTYPKAGAEAKRIDCKP
jgi:tripartite-type tricarboxylate transporter receptor subunit TctC